MSPGASFPGGLARVVGRLSRRVQGGGHRRADQGPKPPSPLPSERFRGDLGRGFGKAVTLPLAVVGRVIIPRAPTAIQP